MIEELKVLLEKAEEFVSGLKKIIAQSVPNPPTGLTEVEKTAGYATLSWTPSGGENGWKVFRDGVQIAPFIGATSFAQYTDTTTQPSTAYSYQVKSFNAAGDSDLSSALVITTNANTPPAWEGINLALVKGQFFSLDLSEVCNDIDLQGLTFTQLSGSISGMTLLGSIYSGIPTVAGEFGPNFRASDGFSTADTSATFTITDTDTTAPTAAVIAGDANGSTVTITLVTPSTDASGISKYRLFRNSVFYQDIIVFSTANPFVETSVADGPYTYFVRAVDGSLNLNESANSNTVSVTVSVVPPVPDVPILSVPVVISDDQINTAWVRGPLGPAPTSYDLQRGTGDGAGNPNNDGVIILASTVNTSLSNTGLDPNQEYWYRVRAHNLESTSAYTARRFATTFPTNNATTYLYQAKYDSLERGPAIDVMPGGWRDAPGSTATNPEGWLHQHCDELGLNGCDKDAPGTSTCGVGEHRGDFPWACNVVTAGLLTCPGWKGQGGQVTNVFQAACPTPFRGTKCVRFEQRPGEKPLAGSGPRVQLRRSGIIPHGVETWIGWADYFPSHVGWAGATPWPIGPDFIFEQIFEDPGGTGPIIKVVNAPNGASFGIRIKADNGAGQTISGSGLNTNITLTPNAWHTFVMRLIRRDIGQQSVLQVWIDKTSSAQAKTIDLTTTAGIGSNVEQAGNMSWMICQYAGPPTFPVYRFHDCDSIARINQIDGDPFTAVHPATSA